MKVLHWLLAAIIGVRRTSSVLANDGPNHHARGGGANPLAALEAGEGGDEGGRGLATCIPQYCNSPDVHFCTKADFLNDRCEDSYYDFVYPDDPITVCLLSEPTVLTAAHVGGCAGKIGTIVFDLYKGGTLFRRFKEAVWPYTVFGDDPAKPSLVKSRQLGPGVYTMNVTIKDPSKCLVEVQNYEFTIAECG
jgi:hypothetical protein